MSLTSLDAKIIIAYAVLTVVLGFTLPALGYTATEQTASDVPDFNVSQTRFDFVDDLPEYPSEPTQGVLNASSNRFDDYRGSIQVELGPGDDGNRTFLVSNTSGGVWITDVEAGTINDQHTFTADGQTHTLVAQGYEIEVYVADLSGDRYEFIVEESPNDSDIPLIGGAIDTADAVANGLFWVGSTFVVLVLLLIEFVANIGGLIFDVAVLFVGYGTWLVSEGSTLISNAPGYAAAILAVVYTPVYWVFAKIVITLVNMVNPFG